MKHMINFLSKIAQVSIIACIVFVLPAVMHSIFTLDPSHYLNDIAATAYCAVMSFISLLVTIFYMVVVAEDVNSNNDRKF